MTGSKCSTLESSAHPGKREVERGAETAIRFRGRYQAWQSQVAAGGEFGPAPLAEGHGRAGRDRFHHFRIADASAKQVDSHLRLLAQAGAINRAKTEKALSIFDEVRAMTWRLLNRKR